ncbi:MAG: hypothetical protein B7C55_14115 [Actinomycetales bacterium mxb001]|nr:MAG: hypothetical protein B7C55_14115 [Actinomycetales bacterium mxb001]
MSTTPPPPPPPAAPQPGGEQPLSQSDERLWAALGQLSGILVSFIGPLLIMLIFGPRSAFVKKESTEALNFQITVAIAYIIGFVLTFVVIGIFIVLAVWVVSLIFMIMAALKNKDGLDYRYPVCIRFIK